MGEATSLGGRNFPEMPRSTLAPLQTPFPMSRPDAYSTQPGPPDAYDHLPEGSALAENLQELTVSIRRDARSKHDGKGTLDTRLATQSLELPVILPCTPAIAHIPPNGQDRETMTSRPQVTPFKLRYPTRLASSRVEINELSFHSADGTFGHVSAHASDRAGSSAERASPKNGQRTLRSLLFARTHRGPDRASKQN